MPPRRLTRDEARAKTRQDLLAAAERLFQKQGFGATSLEQIAREAAVTTGAVYSNFANKEELFLALLAGIEPAVADTSMFDDPSLTPEQQLQRFGETIGRQGHTPTAIAHDMELKAFALRNDRARAVYADFLRNLLMPFGDAVQLAIDAQPATSDLTGLDVILIVQAITEGFIQVQAFLPDLVTPEVIGRAMVLLASALTPVEEVDPPPPKPDRTPSRRRARDRSRN